MSLTQDIVIGVRRFITDRLMGGRPTITTSCGIEQLPMASSGSTLAGGVAMETIGLIGGSGAGVGLILGDEHVVVVVGDKCTRAFIGLIDLHEVAMGRGHSGCGLGRGHSGCGLGRSHSGCGLERIELSATAVCHSVQRHSLLLALYGPIGLIVASGHTAESTGLVGGLHMSGPHPQTCYGQREEGEYRNSHKSSNTGPHYGSHGSVLLVGRDHRH